MCAGLEARSTVCLAGILTFTVIARCKSASSLELEDRISCSRATVLMMTRGSLHSPLETDTVIASTQQGIFSANSARGCGVGCGDLLIKVDHSPCRSLDSQ